MRLCRFDDDRLGLVEGDRVRDVSAALDAIPTARWPLPPGDPLVANLDAVCARVQQIADPAPAGPVAAVRLLSPVTTPTKVMGAPINYNDHIAEAKTDPGLGHGHRITHISELGLFLKANSSLVGPSEGVALRFTDRRNDHELELALIIGKAGTRIAAADAIGHIAAYAMGLDMTVRGPEERSFRKSIDSYSVLGPWLVTADEIEDPDNLAFTLTVNDEMRQASNTRFLVYDAARLIEFASSFYTLYPGDVIMTGTPAGVGPVKAGDVMHCTFEGIGAMGVAVRDL